jgi:hypothetical protein
MNRTKMIRMKLLQRKLKRRHKKKYIIKNSFTFFICCVDSVVHTFCLLLLKLVFSLQILHFTRVFVQFVVYTHTDSDSYLLTYYYDTRYSCTTYYSSTTTVPVPVILLTTTTPPLIPLTRSLTSTINSSN